MSIRWRLIFLVVATLLPLAGFSAFLMHEALESQRAAAERHASDTARALSIALDRDLWSRIAAMRTLASSPSLLAGDFAALRAQALQILAHQPEGSAVLVTDAEGRRLLDTRVPPNETASPGIGATSDVFAEDDFFISDLLPGPAGRDAIVAVELPVRREGRVLYGLTLTLPVASFAALLDAQDLSGGWTAHIVDRSGFVIAGAGAGTALPWHGDVVADGALGAVEVETADGARLVASSYSQLAGWSVIVGTPVSLLEQSLRHSVLLVGGGCLVFLLLGGTAAALTARGIVRPIEALVRSAAPGSPDRVPRLGPSGIREIDELTAALAAASMARRRAVLELRASERRLRLIADALPVLISYIDSGQRYRFVNRAHEQWFGLPRDAIEGRHLREVIGEAAYEELRGHVETALDGHRVEHESYVHPPGGEGRWVSATYVPRVGNDGRTQGFYALVADISERRRAEEAARASEERLRLARAAAGIGLWDWDVQKSELVWSDETYRVHGLEPGAVTPSYETWFATMHPDDRERMAREIAERSFLGHDPNYEYRTVWPDGSVHWVISKGRVFREGARILRLSGVIYEVTGMREAAEALRRMNETLAERVAERTRQLEHEAEQRRIAEAALLQAQRLEALGKLTGGVAHDFNNLLTTIIGNLELIGRAAAGDERIRKLAGAAERAASRGARLTESLLAFARARPMRPETIDVNAMLNEFSALVRRAVGETVRVELDLDPALDRARTDPAQLEAALLNLALNARDAMPEGGTLLLRTRNATLGSEDLADNQDATPGRFVEILVEDTGTGIPDDVRPHVFEPFFTTKEIGRGSGLGLSQVFGFARQSEGDVRLDSVPGKGTKVRLYLPSAPADAAGPDAPKPRVAAGPAGATILLVEDDDDVRDVTAGLLSRWGYKVVAARDGAEALAAVEARRDLDLVLSDVVMPGGMSGVALGRRVREIRPGTGVLLISGYAEEELGAENGADEFELVRKPYNETQLLERVRAALDRPRAAARR